MIKGFHPWHIQAASQAIGKIHDTRRSPQSRCRSGYSCQSHRIRFWTTLKAFFYIMRLDIVACVVNELHFDLSTFPPTVLTLQLLIHFSKSLEYHMKRIATKEKVICLLFIWACRWRALIWFFISIQNWSCSLCLQDFLHPTGISFLAHNF